jgi:type IV secretion system protein VirB10
MASRTPPVDPRLAGWSPAEGAAEADMRPLVAPPRSGPRAAFIVAAIVIAAIILFLLLDSRRRSQVEPAVKVTGPESAGTAAPPPALYIPPTGPADGQLVAPVPVIVQAPPAPPQRVALPQYTAPAEPAVRYYQPPPPPNLPPPPQRVSNSPAVVMDSTGGSGPPVADGPGQGDGDGQASPGGATGAAGQSGGRVRASMFANRSTTVVLGTLIPAVLETAFDSRRAGFARAIVSRDVRGFDGTRVLIPRGSRLTGEYRSDIQPGQKRALINWTRLIRPDGVTIAIGSPSADTLGRGGVKGDYNSHFFERFAGAILQSALQIGVNLASQSANGDNVIIAVPGTIQNSVPSFTETRIVPTLKVPAGTSISVFVARDLDFSAADKAP